MPTSPTNESQPVAPNDTPENEEVDLRPTPPPEGVLPQEWRAQHLGPHRHQFR